MALKDYIVFKQNNVDPSPEAQAFFSRIVEVGFKYAEYVLVLGVFGFLADQTKHWAIYTIWFILIFILYIHMFSMLAGFTYFNWRRAESKILKFLLWAMDSSIYLICFVILSFAFWQVSNALQKGIGI